MKINVKETTMVKPLEPAPRKTLRLSNLDVVYPDYVYTKTCYFYPFNGDPDFFNPATLKTALARSLALIYPVAGRLKRKDDKARLELDCNDEGVPFSEAEVDVAMEAIPDDIFVPTLDTSQGISTCPLFLVRLNRFKCGGVCLGMAFNHHVADGLSCVQFKNTWSDIARGLDVKVPPFLDRDVLLARTPPQPKFSHIEYQPPPTVDIDIAGSGQIVFKNLKLSAGEVSALKDKCKEDDGRKGYSTFEVLSGHAWRCVAGAYLLPDDQETKVCVSIDGRARLQPRLPLGYFGNATFHANPIALAGELKSNPVKFAVRKVREALVRMDDEYLKSAIDYLELQSDITSSIPQNLLKFGCPNLLIISWNRLPFYETDFGWGKPIQVGSGGTLPGGVSLVLPADEGGILYGISLSEQQMERFEKLFHHI